LLQLSAISFSGKFSFNIQESFSSEKPGVKLNFCNEKGCRCNLVYLTKDIAIGITRTTPCPSLKIRRGVGLWQIIFIAAIGIALGLQQSTH